MQFRQRHDHAALNSMSGTEWKAPSTKRQGEVAGQRLRFIRHYAGTRTGRP